MNELEHRNMVQRAFDQMVTFKTANKPVHEWPKHLQNIEQMIPRDLRMEHVLTFLMDLPIKYWALVDDVNHPSHYQGATMEVIDIIDDFELDFCMGNAVKYILRAGKKYQDNDGFKQDLEKAIWYLKRKIESI